MIDLFKVFMSSNPPHLLCLTLTMLCTRKFLHFIVFSYLSTTCNSQAEPICSSSCGDLPIQSPFRLKGDPSICGDPKYELTCHKNRTVLNLYHRIYYVSSILYNNMTIHIVDSGLSSSNCSSLPRYSLRSQDFIRGDPYVLVFTYDLVLLSCSVPVENSPSYLDASPCVTNLSSPRIRHAYLIVGAVGISALEYSCETIFTVPTKINTVLGHSVSDFHQEMVNGFELSWGAAFCGDCEVNGGYCSAFDIPITGGSNKSPCVLPCTRVFESFHCFKHILWSEVPGFLRLPMKILGVLFVRFSIGILLFSSYLIYRWWRSKLLDESIKQFLRDYENLKPRRYSYLEIKNMTGNFKEQLGQGGFGSVYKGRLSNNHLVAVKVLKSPKGNDQDFINEVAAIGGIHHVNVVQLVGFCVEGSKRALIYEYMPNGSLDKHLFNKKGGCCLSWKDMYEIALATARGIEYLHRGCDMRILHFDIKPHNILLDQHFVPKISDFGLAKLYPRSDSTVSLTEVRGTIGYMAPELFYKNIGGVSYKSDVYSYGMLLMEMVGRRKNLNILAENLSQVYFPTWIYEQIDVKGEMEIENGTVEEKKMAKRMIMVALWCIQVRPMDRPSMTKVVEMLEETSELPAMPPEPFKFSDQGEEDCVGLSSTDEYSKRSSQSASDSINISLSTLDSDLSNVR